MGLPLPRSFLPPPAIVELVRKAFRLYFGVFHFTRFTGRENLPPQGPVLLAANHTSYYDAFLVATGQDLLVRFMTWDVYFSRPVLGRFISDWGAFPMDPEGSDPGGYRQCLKLLKAGERVLVFPEGRRSFDGELLPLMPGVARLAIRAGAPIVPVRITGAHRAWPRGDFAPRPWFEIQVHYERPIHPRPVRTAQERRAESARITAALEEALRSRPPR